MCATRRVPRLRNRKERTAATGVARPFEAHGHRPRAVSTPQVVGPAIGVPGE
jgi:hypothetical protein